MREIGFTGNILQNDEGAPNLPSISRYIAIPQGATVNLEVISSRQEIFQNMVIAPAPHIPLDTDRGPLQYNKNMSIYARNAFYPAQPVIVSEPTKMRGVDLVLINVTPYRYNPVTRELIVYRDIQVNVTFTGGNGIFGETRYRNRYWDPILRDNIMNSSSLPIMDYNQQAASRANSDDTGFEYLIIVPNDLIFKKWADTIKVFRTEQGILTGIVTLQQIGNNTTTAIENYINNAYNTWDIPPVAVLIMADFGNSAANSIPAPIWDNYCASDNIYADVDNNDLPDIVFARMTANNEDQLKTYVEKFLNYERTPPTSSSFYNHPITALGWQTERWFQICSEVIGGFFINTLGKDPVRINEVYSGNPNVDPWSTATNTNTVVNYFGPNGLNYIPATPQQLGGFSGGNAQDVNDALNAGAFLLQHRDHGMETGWGEPSYTNTNIDGLTNIGKLSYILSVNCLTGKYNWNSECFAEKFHRYKYNNQYAGCVGILAASETSYSFVNDTYVWGLYDNMWPEFMPGYGAMYEERGLLPAFGNAAGKYFLQQSSWPYNTDNKVVTYHLFHHHGDAFLTLFSEVPQQLTVFHDPVMISTATSFYVTADAGAFIALTYNDEIVGTATATGLPVAVPISPVPIGATVKVCVTKQNHYRHYSNFLVISPNGPYVVTNSYTVNDPLGNNNLHLDTGEDAYLSLAEENLGYSASLNTQVTIQLADPFITFIDNTEDYDTVAAQSIKTVPDGFRVQIADNVPNMHSVLATVTATNGTDSWSSHIMLEVWAPYLEVGDLIIDDSQGGNNNGRLDPGETADIIIENDNSGESMAINALSSLSLTSGFLTLNNATYTVGNINANSTAQAIYNVTVNPLAPAGLPVDLIYEVVAEEYSAQHTFHTQVGLIVEDWETGDFSKFPWTAGGNAPWVITNIGPFEGVYSAKSGAIGNTSSSQLIINYNIPSNDSLRFTLKVSSEANKDFLKFYVDNVQKGSWSGGVSWTSAAFPVSAGNHTFKWVYSKDGTGTGGVDAAWLDYIIFPVPLVTTSYAGIDSYVCESSSFQCSGNAANYNTVLWTTSGTGSFNDNTILEPIYTPSSLDIQTGLITLTLTVNGISGISSDDMLLTIIQPPQANAGINGEICHGASFPLDGASAVNYSLVTWTTSGTGYFNDIHALNPEYTPSAEDAVTGIVTLTMTATNQACPSVSSLLNLSVHALPQPSVSGNLIVCAESSGQSYSTVQVTGNTYAWNVTGGTITSGTGTNNISVNWGTAGSGLISVTETTAFGCASTLEIPVTVNPLPEPQITGEQANCTGDSRIYSSPLVAGNNYTWDAIGATIVSGQNTNELSVRWDIAGEYTISLTETINETQCSRVAAYPILVRPMPEIPSTPAGAAEVDLYKLGSSDYTITGVPLTDYTWQILPAEAGIIAGNGATATVTWNSNFRGDATVQVKASNDCGVSEWSNAITTHVFSSLGVEQGDGLFGIEITPNPNNGQFKLTITSVTSGTLSYYLLSASGATVAEKLEIPFNGKHVENLDLKLSSGTYTLKVENNLGSSSRKLIVK
jgi:hypothetical protein